MRRAAIPGLLASLLLAAPVAFLLLTVPVAAQQGDPAAASSTSGGDSSRTSRIVPALPAIRIQGEAPRIDGVLDDDAWKLAPVATDFLQLEPNEGEPATERTEVRVLYGDDALYVAFRAHDSSPDSIAAQLTRRDQNSYSDLVHVLIDSYFDRRTAFHFAVNPLGVKHDIYRFDDTEEDSSWDAVWEAATRMDEQGWTAEIRIPYSQLRFGNQDPQTWGINFGRGIARRNETSLWSPIRQSDAAVVSRSGELRDLRGLGSPRRVELRPFSMARLARAPGDAANPFHRPNDVFASAGLDLKYGLTNDLTLDVTMNPDFGQVEADPAQVNLTAFETFYPEQRPFFMEGSGIFRFGIGLGDGDMGSESLFYSRRIGRPPQGRPNPRGGYAESPDLTTILGAWKLSGKTQGGWSIGLLHAVTAEETARISTEDGADLLEPVEPLTNYGVARVQRDFREGRSAMGFISTATHRQNDVAHELRLRSGAYTGGFDARHRFGSHDQFLVDGYLLGSHVRGSPEAMDLTQRAPSRYFQRPDAEHVDYDPTRTSMSGWAGNVGLFKMGGGYWRWGTVAVAKSPGFEANDLGYQREADLLVHAAFLGYNRHTPGKHFRRWNLNTNAWHGWSFGGEHLALGANLNGSFTLPSYWGGFAGVNREFSAFSNGALRGGPLLRREASTNGWFGVSSDERKAVRASWNNNWSKASESGSWSANSSLSVRWRPSGRASISAGPFFSRNVNDAQWVQRVQDQESHYLFGHMDQKTLGLTGRMDLTFLPDLTLQLYAQPFVSAGAYSEFKQVADPRARTYRDRFAPVDAVLENGQYRADLSGNGVAETFRNPDFNVRQFRSTAVVRWEYRPGSILYLVWSQGRSHFLPDGRFQLGESLGDLFRQDSENVVMLKVSYWISP
jgi:hypothetical protein